MKLKTVLLITVCALLGLVCAALVILSVIVANVSQQEMTPLERRGAEVSEKHRAVREVQDWKSSLEVNSPFYAEECVFAQLQDMGDPYFLEPTVSGFDSDDLSIVTTVGRVVYSDNGKHTTKVFRARFRVTTRFFGKEKWETLECSIKTPKF